MKKWIYIVVLCFYGLTAYAQDYGRVAVLDSFKNTQIACATFTKDNTLLMAVANSWCNPDVGHTSSLIEMNTDGEVLRSIETNALVDGLYGEIVSITYNPSDGNILLLVSVNLMNGRYKVHYLLLDEDFNVKNASSKVLPRNYYCLNVSCRWDANTSEYYGSFEVRRTYSLSGSVVFSISENGDLEQYVYHQDIDFLSDVVRDDRASNKFVGITEIGEIVFFDSTFQLIQRHYPKDIDGRVAPGTAIMLDPLSDTKYVIHSSRRYYDYTDFRAPTLTTVSEDGRRKGLSIQTGQEFDDPFGYNSVVYKDGRYYIGSYEFNYHIPSENPKKRFSLMTLDDTLGVLWTREYVFEDELHNINGMTVSDNGDIFLYGRTERGFNIIEGAVGYLLDANGAMSPDRITLTKPWEYHVYPNPVNSALTLTFDDDFGGDAHMEVLQSDGKCILREAVTKQNSIVTQDWSPGIYYIRVIDSKGRSDTRKIVKQ